MLDQKLKKIAPLFLRVGISLVFIWFGIEQIINTAMWTSFVPDWVMNYSPFTVETLVHFNGSFEIVFGLALLIGLYTRISSFLLALHMVHIISIVGYDSIAIRDFGLVVATFTVFFLGYDSLSVDNFLAETKIYK